MEEHWPQARGCCLEHDDKYEAGGDDRDRLIADVSFFLCLLTRNLPPAVAEQAYNGVRIFGGLYWPDASTTERTPTLQPVRTVQAP